MPNRYRLGLKTCPQAKMSKSGHAIFSLFRTTSMTQPLIENTRALVWTFSPVSVNASKIGYHHFIIPLVVIGKTQFFNTVFLES